MREPETGLIRLGSTNNLPMQQVIALSSDHTTRPIWVKFSFPDLFGSLKWRRMTLAQKGAYIVLLGEQAINGPLPTDPEDLACIVACSSSNVTEDQFLEAWKAPLQECFEERDGKLINPRMAAELEDYSDFASELSAKRSAAGKAGAAKREANRKQSQAKPSKAKQAPSKSKQTHARSEEIRVEESTGDKRERKPAKAPAPKKQTQVDLISELVHSYQPVWVRSLALEWAEYRDDPKTKAKGIALVSWKKNIAKLARLPEAVARDLIDAMIAGNWMGPVWENAQQASAQAPSRGSYSKDAPIKPAEKNRIVSEIRMRYAQKTGDFLLDPEVAMEMARKDNDPQAHRLDWRIGLRSDPPPLNSTPTPDILEITNEPPF